MSTPVRATVVSIAELSNMYPLVSLCVRIIEVRDVEPNNTASGQIIRDAKGLATKKMQLILRDASGGIRATFWKIPDDIIRSMVVSACVVFYNVRLARASGKYSDYHWLSVSADPTGSTPSTIEVIRDDGSLPVTVPTKILEPRNVSHDEPVRTESVTSSKLTPQSTPTKRERDDEREKCALCGLLISSHPYCPKQKGKVEHKSVVCVVCGLNKTEFETCSKTGDAHDV